MANIKNYIEQQNETPVQFIAFRGGLVSRRGGGGTIRMYCEEEMKRVVGDPQIIIVRKCQNRIS